MTEDFTQACDVMQDATRAMRKVAEAILKQPAAVVNVAPKGPDVVVNQAAAKVEAPSVIVEQPEKHGWEVDLIRDSYGKLVKLKLYPLKS